MLHVDAFEGRLIREEEAVIKGVLGIDVVPENDVRQLEGQYRDQRTFVRQGVDQALAENDGIADSNRFKRRRQHHPAVHVSSKIDLVGNDQVVDFALEDLVIGAGSRHQAGLRQPIDHVLFCL